MLEYYYSFSSTFYTKVIFTVHKRSCGKVMLLHVFVCSQEGRGKALPPWDQTPPAGPYTLLGPYPRNHKSGRYASYWNAFLYNLTSNWKVVGVCSFWNALITRHLILLEFNKMDFPYITNVRNEIFCNLQGRKDLQFLSHPSGTRWPKRK